MRIDANAENIAYTGEIAGAHNPAYAAMNQPMADSDDETIAVDRRYTIAFTLFAVMAVLWLIDWVWSSPALFITGGFLGSAGCFIAADAKKRWVNRRSA